MDRRRFLSACGRGLAGLTLATAPGCMSVTKHIPYPEPHITIGLRYKSVAQSFPLTPDELAFEQAFVKASQIKYDEEKYGRIEINPFALSIQTPEETGRRGKGMCLDQAVYLSYLLKQKGLRSNVVAGFGYYDTFISAYNSFHAWNEIDLRTNMQDGFTTRTYLVDMSGGERLAKPILEQLEKQKCAEHIPQDYILSERGIKIPVDRIKGIYQPVVRKEFKKYDRKELNLFFLECSKLIPSLLGKLNPCRGKNDR